MVKPDDLDGLLIDAATAIATATATATATEVLLLLLFLSLSQQHLSRLKSAMLAVHRAPHPC